MEYITNLTKAAAGYLLGQPWLTTPRLEAQKQKPLVLLYHGVTPETVFDGIENYHGKHVTMETFRQQLRWLKTQFQIVPLSEIESLIGGVAPEQPLCAITFDDGYKNNFQTALPALVEEGLTATFFLTSGFIESQSPLWPDRLEYALNHTPLSTKEKIEADRALRAKLKRSTESEKAAILDNLEAQAGTRLDSSNWGNYAPLNWSEARELATAGMSLGAHTITHPILSQLTSADQRQEISGSKKALEKAGLTPKHFAYPNGQAGDWDINTERLVAEAGWQYAWTTQPERIRVTEVKRFALPRLTVTNRHHLNRFRALISGLLP